MRMSPGEALRRQRLQKKRDWYLRKENLLHFARDLCGYDKLQDGFHGEICDWLAAHADHLYIYWSAARGHYKTTLQIADAAQDLLRDPLKTHLWIHNTLSQAAKAAKELAWHFQYNEKIRELWPELCVAPGKKFYRSPASDGTATFELPPQAAARSAQPSFTACSIEKDVTGMHISGSVRMDDLISADTINESGGLQKVADYWQHTVIPVMDPGCVARNTGTRWDAADLYGKWIASPRWATLVRAVLEDADGNPDWAGKNVGVISDDELEFRREEMGALFGPQMMNDPAPIAERLWSQSHCEHPLVPYEHIRNLPGVTILFGDPAPALIGSPSFKKETERGDMSKDAWAWAVIRFVRNENRQEMYLLDGTHSIDWDVKDGFDEGARLAKKWGALRAGVDSTGSLGPIYQREWAEATRRAGIICPWLKLMTMTKADSKNYRVATLASRARQNEFYICSSCPIEFWQPFYDQIRPYRKIGPGKNNLRNDDLADVVAYGTDPAVDDLIPMPIAHPLWVEEDAYEDDGPSYGRYI